MVTNARRRSVRFVPPWRRFVQKPRAVDAERGSGICGFQNDGDSESGKTLENSKHHVVLDFKWMDVWSEWKNHFAKIKMWFIQLNSPSINRRFRLPGSNAPGGWVIEWWEGLWNGCFLDDLGVDDWCIKCIQTKKGSVPLVPRACTNESGRLLSATLLVGGFQERNSLEYVWVAEDIAPSNNYYCIQCFFGTCSAKKPLVPLKIYLTRYLSWDFWTVEVCVLFWSWGCKHKIYFCKIQI